MALPPDWSTRSPAAVASGWLVAMTPWRASTAERVPRVFPAGLSPAGCCMSTVAAMKAAAVIRMRASYRKEVGGWVLEVGGWRLVSGRLVAFRIEFTTDW